MASNSEVELINLLLQNATNSSMVQPEAITDLYYNIVFLQTLQLTYSGVLTITLMMELSWLDSRLSWNKNDFSPHLVTLSTSKIWVPKLSLVNTATNTDAVAPQTATLAYVESTGNVSWMFTTQLTTSCPLNLAAFPFDEQHCAITIICLSLRNDYDPAVFFHSDDESSMTRYKQTGEFELVNFTLNQSIQDDDESGLYCQSINCFAAMNVTLKYRRFSSYYVLQMIVPACIITLLLAFAFAIPSENGVKLPMACTLMVSLYTLQQSVARVLPAAEQTTLLAIGISFSLILAGLTVVIVALMISIKGSSPAPLGRVKNCCKKSAVDSLVEAPESIRHFGSPVADTTTRESINDTILLKAIEAKPKWVNSIEEYLIKSIELQQQLLNICTAQAQDSLEVKNKQRATNEQNEKFKNMDTIVNLIMFVVYMFATIFCIVTFYFPTHK